MNRVIAGYDLDADHNRLWVNADLETMPETVIVKNIREGKEQTSTFKLREVVSYEEGYADGFDRGQEAIVQQIDGIANDDWRDNGEKVEEIVRFVNDFLRERDGL